MRWGQREVCNRGQIAGLARYPHNSQAVDKSYSLCSAQAEQIPRLIMHRPASDPVPRSHPVKALTLSGDLQSLRHVNPVLDFLLARMNDQLGKINSH